MINSVKPDENTSIKRTKEAFKKALLELVNIKPFRSISVQDLVANSGYGRSTFYSHFHDKFDLNEWIINDEAMNYVDTVRKAILDNSPVNSDDSMYEACYAILN